MHHIAEKTPDHLVKAPAEAEPKPRTVSLFRNGANQAVRIPKEFELPGSQAVMRREGNRLIIEAVEVKHPRGSAGALVQTTPDVLLCTSVVVQCELLFGLRRRTHSRRQTHCDRVLESVELLPLNSDVAPVCANLRSLLESAGTPTGPNDTFIAAQALALNATLVTADAEFLRVPGLRVENWLAQEEATTSAAPV